MANYNLHSHVKSDKVKWIVTGIVIFLVTVFCVGAGLQLWGKGKVQPSNWFTKTEVCEHVDDDTDGVCDECGEDMPEDEESDELDS